jgi:two-component sensor histidine kinase
MDSPFHVANSIPPKQGGDAAEELVYRLRQQQLTAEFGLFALQAHVSVDQLLQEATRICALGMHTSLCKVMVFQPDQGDFLMAAGVGWKPGYVRHARAGADLASPAGYAFQTDSAVIANHLQTESRFRTPHILADHDIKRAINVVLHVAGSRYGVLEVDSRGEVRFTEADLAFMQGFANVLGVALDRTRFEEALKANEQQLKQALEYQNVLTQEVSHRVKNSLAIVAGLLQVQSRDSSIPEVRKALKDAETRVLAIAQLHDCLWRTGNVHSLNLADFLAGLCEQFSGASPANVVTCDAPAVMIPTDVAIPLGLLINELLTNSVKYASPKKPGDVCIKITASADGLRLEVRDHGPGLPTHWKIKKPDSLGMKLIVRLSRQLGGKPEWNEAFPGTRFVLEFPMDGSSALTPVES